MLAKVVCILVVSTTVLCQNPGTNYQTADGHVRSESVDQEGNVRGQYSYIDPTGKTITVRYTAGKNGFQVDGDNQEQAPPTPAVHPSLNTAPHQFPAQPVGSQPNLPFAAAPSEQGIFSPSTNPFAQAATRAQIEQFGQAQAEAAQFAATPSPTQFTPPAGVPTAPADTRQSPPVSAAPKTGTPTQALLAGFNPQFPPQFLELQRAAQFPRTVPQTPNQGQQIVANAAAPGVQYSVFPQPDPNTQPPRLTGAPAAGLQYSGFPQRNAGAPLPSAPLNAIPADQLPATLPEARFAPSALPPAPAFSQFQQLSPQPQFPLAAPAQFQTQQQFFSPQGRSPFLAPHSQLPSLSQPQFLPQPNGELQQRFLLQQQQQQGSVQFLPADSHRFSSQSPLVQNPSNSGAYRLQ